VHLGIDFGTTRTVVAVCDRGNYPIVSFMNDDGDPMDWYPSVAAQRGDDICFGFDALARASQGGWRLLRSFKRVLSAPVVSPQTHVAVGDTSWPIMELMARFLASLQRDIIARSNAPARLLREERMPAVVATPANAHSTQRFVTLEAFRRAGFQVMGMINEPSAAGFEYAHRYRSTLTSKREHIVVYDLGGGTFDASLVRMSGRHHDVVATAGIGRLGGDDFDALLANLALDRSGLPTTEITTQGMAALLDLCRTAKEALTPNSKRIVIDLESALGPVAAGMDVTISTADYYDACTPLVARTIEAMRPVLSRAESGSGKSSGIDDVAGIYVVGGASALPAVARVLRGEFGRRVHRSQYPSAATAIGLAIAGNPESGFLLTDRFSRTFGVFRESMDGASVSFDPIFTRETTVPSSPEERVVSTRTYRAAHNIGHFRYVECASVDDGGSPRGDITPFADVLFAFDKALAESGMDLRAVPIRRIEGRGPLVQEMYSLDAHGFVEVTIRNLDAGYETVHRLGGDAGA